MNTTYQFDFTVVTDGITEDDALGEAMQLLADYRFAKEAATVTILDDGGLDDHRYNETCGKCGTGGCQGVGR